MNGYGSTQIADGIAYLPALTVRASGGASAGLAFTAHVNSPPQSRVVILASPSFAAPMPFSSVGWHLSIQRDVAKQILATTTPAAGFPLPHVFYEIPAPLSASMAGNTMYFQAVSFSVPGAFGSYANCFSNRVDLVVAP